jgi:predicted transcriptional regulator of viral defense system
LAAPIANALSILASQGQSIFALDQFAAALGRPPARIYRILSKLLVGGWVARLTKGTYLIVPLEAGPESAWTEDALVIAGHLAAPSAAAYWSACHYWNWTEQAPRTVFVETTQRKMRSTRTVLGVEYRFVTVRPWRFFGTVERPAGRGRIVVTDREKTLVDALDRPDLCGGIRQVIEMLPEAAEAVRWDKVEAYLEKMGSGALYKRLGLLVEMLGEKVKVPDRKRRLEAWRSRLTGGYAPLDPGGPASGPVNSRWRVRVNVPALAAAGARG